MNNYNDEVDTIDIIWTILRRWRMLILFMLIGGILFGAFKAYKDIVHLNDSKAIQKELDEYNESLEEYENQKANLDRQIEVITKSIVETEFEEKNCYILSIDSYNVNKRIIIYYIDSGYEIMPNMSYQNINYNSTIANIYTTALTNTDFDYIVRTNEDDERTIMNPVYSSVKFELIAITTETSGNVIKVCITGLDINKVEQITKEINSIIDETHSVINQKIKEHTISIVDIKDSIIAEPSIKSVQDVFVNKQNQLYSNLDNVKKQLKALKSPSKPSNKFSINMKWIIIGAFGGVATICLCVFFKIISGKLLSVKDYKEKLRMDVLGTVETKHNNRFDKWLLRKLGFFSTAGESVERSVILSKVGSIDTNAKVIITGPVKKESLIKIQGYLDGCCETIVLDSLVSSEGIDKIKTSDMVIFVGRLYNSDLNSLNLQKEFLEKINKQLSGIVVTD